jgi:hypothetical protein
MPVVRGVAPWLKAAGWAFTAASSIMCTNECSDLLRKCGGQ